MVAVRDIHLKDNFTLEEWVSSLSLSDSEKDQLRTVYQYCLTLGDEALTSKLLVRGIEMVGILQMLSMDIGTLKAAIIYPFVEAGLISQERMDEDFGSKIAKLVEGGAGDGGHPLPANPPSQRNLAGAGRQRASHVARHGRGCARRGDQAGGADRLPAGSEDGR